MASLIFRHAGVDLEARQSGVEAEVVVVRRLIIEKLNELHSAAETILATPHANREVSALEIAIADIIGRPVGWSGVPGARRYIAILKELASVPIPPNLAKFGEKPELDAMTTRIVIAIAEYCSRLGIQFAGRPKRQQADNKAVHFAKSGAAKLVEDVLDALAVDYKPSQIATHMTKAQSVLPMYFAPGKATP